MTEEEFVEQYRQQLNLAESIPVDIFEAFANSFCGITRAPGETNDDLLQRIADYLGPTRACHSSRTGSSERPAINYELVPPATRFARQITRLRMWSKNIRRSIC